MTPREKALSQLLQLSESEAEILTGEISRDYAVLPDSEVLEEHESLPSGWWVCVALLTATVVVCTALVCSVFCAGV